MTTIGGASAAALAGIQRFQQMHAAAAVAISGLGLLQRAPQPPSPVTPVAQPATSEQTEWQPTDGQAEAFVGLLLSRRGVQANVAVARTVHDAYRSVLDLPS